MRATALFRLLSCAALTAAEPPTESCDCRQCRAESTPEPPAEAPEGTAEEAMDCASYLTALRGFYARAQALTELLDAEPTAPDERAEAVGKLVSELQPGLPLVQSTPPQAEPGLFLQVEESRLNGGVICCELARSVVQAISADPALREPLAPVVQQFQLSTQADYPQEEWEAAAADIARLKAANDTLLCALPLLESVRSRATAAAVAPELDALREDLAKATDTAQALIAEYTRNPQTAWATANGLLVNTSRLLRVLDRLMNTEPRCYGSAELEAILLPALPVDTEATDPEE